MIQGLFYFCLGVAAAGTAVAAEIGRGIEGTYAAHARGVELARQGRYDEALAILWPLLARFPDDYPLVRDITLITIWNGDCSGALARFDSIRDDSRNPPYLIVPAVDCLLAENRPTEALALAEAGRARHPDDAGLEHAHTKVQVALRVRANYDDRIAAETSFVWGKSDRGIREWLARAETSAPIVERARLFARYLVTRVSRTEFDAGDMNRAGAGVRWRPSARWRLRQEFSTDVHAPGLDGSHTLVEYKPYDAWTVALAHDTYAEDISVRARANGIEATRSEGGVEYNSRDYVWYGRVAAARYDFTDTNRRTSLFGTVGYAYAMLPQREQRLYLEWYQSRNTLDDAVYFNPTHDRSVGLVHRTDFVHDSRFKRHVDHLFFTVASYRQEGFGAHGKWGVKYEQDYDFDSADAFVAGVAFNRNVYDGRREDEWRVELLYRKRF